jgi:hypothetical protein
VSDHHLHHNSSDKLCHNYPLISCSSYMYVFNNWLCSSSFWKLLLVHCSGFLFFDSVRGFFRKQQLDCIPKEPFIVELFCASASVRLSAFQAVQATLLKHRLQTISVTTTHCRRLQTYLQAHHFELHGLMSGTQIHQLHVIVTSSI